MNKILSGNVWATDYKRLLKGQPKNSWIPWVVEGMEISVVHTSKPHGMLSWGWDGRWKLVLSDLSEYRPKIRRQLRDKLFVVAMELAKTLNREFPKGLF